jgi:hypothetical protein
LPQVPQFLLSVLVSTQPPLQAVGVSGGQVAQIFVLFLTCLQ